MTQYAFFFIQLIIIHFASRASMQRIFFMLKKVFRSTSVTFYFVSLLYLPGTILHEVSHLLTSVLLFVIPESMSFIPNIQKKQGGYAARFGSVHHPKTDPIRGTLIGSSPIVFGLGFFYSITAFSLFPHENIWINILMLYLIFVISSSMFSSKQDMKDSLILIPVIIAVGAVLYYSNIDIARYALNDSVLEFLQQLNWNLLIATVLNSVVAVALGLLFKSRSRSETESHSENGIDKESKSASPTNSSE